MPLPLPVNARMHDHPIEGRGVAFQVEVDGCSHCGFITNESLDALYCRHRCDADRIRRVEQHSYIGILLRERVRVGIVAEPIAISSLTKGPHSVPCPLCEGADAEFWFVDSRNRRHFRCLTCSDFQISRRVADIVADRPPDWRKQLSTRAAAAPPGQALVIGMPTREGQAVDAQYVSKADLPR